MQGKRGRSGTFNMQLQHEFTLKPGMEVGEEAAAGDDAAAVIRALLVRLSILTCLLPDSATAHVTNLKGNGQLVITVRATGVVTPSMTGDDVRQKFLLAVHRGLAACDAPVA